MRTSPSHALKKFVASIHPQLPLDARESQRLLTVLKSTFRKQLDKQHPPPNTPSDPSANRPSPSHVKPISFDGSRAVQNLSSYATASDHLESILANPLFASGPREASTDKRATQPIHPAVCTFRGLAARGAADLNSAEKCLRAALKVGKPSKSGKAAVASAGAGSEVLAWLRSSGALASKDFRKDTILLRALIGCLVAEGRGSIVESWLQSDTAPTNNDWHKGIVSGLVHATIVFNEGVENALTIFLRCLDVHERRLSPLNDANGEQAKPSDSIVYIFQSAGSRLTKIMTASNRKPSIAAPLYNQWTARVPHWMRNPGGTVAGLQLHHPSEPDATGLICHLKSLDISEATQWPPAVRQQRLETCIDAAHLLLSQQKQEDSAWVTDYAKQILREAEITVEGEASLYAKRRLRRRGNEDTLHLALG